LRLGDCADIFARRIYTENLEVPRHGSSGFFTTEDTEEHRGTAGNLGHDEPDEQDGSEFTGFGMLECWDTHPVNPVCDFGCSSVALCGPLWFMPLIFVWGFA
jgi:hypothetical protein